MLDLIIVGGGPIGIAIGLEAQKAGLNYLILEKGVFRSWLPFFTQWPTFPQIFVDGKFVGGVDVVTEMIENE